MKIETITAHYSLTQSLSGYCNVRPGLSATAALDEGDDPDQAMDDLVAQLKKKVRGLVDEALEQDCQPPRYFDGQRYDLYRLAASGPGCERLTVAAFIWPSEADRPQLPEGYSLGWCHMGGETCANRRLEWLRGNYRRFVRSGDLPLFECLAGILSDELLVFAQAEKERLEVEDTDQGEDDYDDEDYECEED